LDKDTTGALILAKQDAIFDAMVQQFKTKEVQKAYLALVDGVPQKESGTIENYLGKLKTWQGQSLWGAVDPQQGLHALTHWKRLRKGPQCALVECIPVTGRTHQLRVHLAGMGHPILGDKQYGGGFRCPYPAQRTLLHAARLSFKHPVTQAPLMVEAPLPADFNNAIAALWKVS
jgi:23S rRNA pseudouridine955/2504/2580 synthase/23S rRNA pseudouridine1911/1915/1917 synthase